MRTRAKQSEADYLCAPNGTAATLGSRYVSRRLLSSPGLRDRNVDIVEVLLSAQRQRCVRWTPLARFCCPGAWPTDECAQQLGLGQSGRDGKVYAAPHAARLLALQVPSYATGRIGPNDYHR